MAVLTKRAKFVKVDDGNFFAINSLSGSFDVFSPEEMDVINTLAQTGDVTKIEKEFLNDLVVMRRPRVDLVESATYGFRIGFVHFRDIL